ncbi:MAG: polysaccharide pyruvyl transferase family protein [Verrucomicrobia bacterium]|nr:polysaccharide pyruvyl transferase family protein [Verrucomicrobiota bacterium]
MKITLNGYYGFANYGDELFNLASVLAARRWWQGHKIDILGPPVAGIDASFRVPRWFPRSLYTAPAFHGKLSRLSFLAAAMLTRDLLVYAGGSTLSYGSIMKKIQRIAAERGLTKFAGIGVSIGPFADAADEAEAARFLRKFSYFSVRDKKSVALLEKMRVPVKPLLARDLAGVLPLLLPPAKPDAAGAAAQPPTLGVSLCYSERLSGGDTAREDRRNAALVEGIVRFTQRERVRVRIFCLNTHPIWGDAALSGQLQALLEARGVPVEPVSAENNLIGCWHGLASCTAVLSVRLHGGITAYVCGVPFSLIEYHVKCADLLDDIGQAAALRIGPDFADPAGVDRILELLFRQPPRPTLPRETYTAEAALNYTRVPWATPGDPSGR